MQEFIEAGPFNITPVLMSIILFIIGTCIIIWVLTSIQKWWDNLPLSTRLRGENLIIILIIYIIFFNSYAWPGNIIVKNDEVMEGSIVPMIPFIDEVYQLPTTINKVYYPYKYDITWADGKQGYIEYMNPNFKNTGTPNPERELTDAITFAIDKYGVRSWTSDQAYEFTMYTLSTDPIKYNINTDITTYLWNHGITAVESVDKGFAISIHMK